MPTRILEIGAGSLPAIDVPGTAFAEPAHIEYVALDALPEEFNPTLHSSRPQIEALYQNATFLAGDSAALPFRNEVFDAVIQRSVFGEYTMPPEFTGSSQFNTQLGPYEAFRVLRPGGTITIAEENTPRAPATPTSIAGILLDAGFTNVRVFPCQEMTNPAWHEARTRYWGIPHNTQDKKWSFGEPIDKRWGYVVTADRPEAELEVFQAKVGLHGIWKANRKRGWDHPDNQQAVVSLEFQSAATIDETDTDNHFERLKAAVIVDKDGIQTDLHSYSLAASRGQTPRLFE